MDSIDVGSMLEQIGGLVTTWGLRVIGALAVLVIGRAIARALRRAVTRGLTRHEADAALVPFLSGLAYWLAILLVLVAVLGLFGIPTASFVAVLGAAGLAVGLAMQGTLSNFAAGVMLLIFRPFGLGDFVEVAGVVGKVAEIGIFSTIINTPDNVRIIAPNAEIFGQVIKNFNGNDKRRIDLVMGVSYDDDLSVAQATLERVLAETPGVLADPEPVVAVHELADSSVNFVVRPWCNTDEYWGVRWEVTRRAKQALEAGGCTIPFPQRDVHLYSSSDAA